ncbi:predicted protein [Candida tropicalis MYA-3404]|uniref:Uncharacterized protein n=1 Tax=Candida tropicalis (strain ATCC MYA-3404 / T1) TaxID=294747 RepID=C5MHA1_CANTT|nr:predicted protein [Candida tropicalis MYA-3404]EER31003.1 predicted protein [Candida tropicalis MYA-3404]KAG4404563.1 hypothetical protein JTP64_006316 [Candida tropicalis]
MMRGFLYITFCLYSMFSRMLIHIYDLFTAFLPCMMIFQCTSFIEHIPFLHCFFFSFVFCYYNNKKYFRVRAFFPFFFCWCCCWNAGIFHDLEETVGLLFPHFIILQRQGLVSNKMSYGTHY